MFHNSLTMDDKTRSSQFKEIQHYGQLIALDPFIVQLRIEVLIQNISCQCIIWATINIIGDKMMQSSGIRFQTVTTFIIGDLSVGSPYSNDY